jgi:hypothetical protein
MSDRNDRVGNASVGAGKATPMPEYRYQKYEGKSGGASSNQEKSPVKVLAELQNFVVSVA